VPQYEASSTIPEPSPFLSSSIYGEFLAANLTVQGRIRKHQGLCSVGLKSLQQNFRDF